MFTAFVSLQKTINPRLVAFFLVAALFALPLSSTGKSIAFAAAMFCIVASLDYLDDLRKALLTPWSLAAIGLFLLAVLGLCWSPASWSERLLVIEKYSKLLYLPFLAVGFRDSRVRTWALHAFLLAMLVTCLVSVFKSWFPDAAAKMFVLSDPGDVFRNHIMTSYMMAFAIYLCATFQLAQQKPSLRWGYRLLESVLTAQLLLINTGRTGEVIYFILMGLWLLQHRFAWRQMLFRAVLLVVLALNALLYSPVVKQNIENTKEDLQRYGQQDKNTDIGYRLQFHDYAHRLYLRHPVRGNGTASFTHLYAAENPVPAWSRRLLEPHSQYWLVASEWGALGMVALLAFLAILAGSARRLKQQRPMAVAVLLSFMACNVTDSFLFYSGTGYFFIGMMALCFGEFFG